MLTFSVQRDPFDAMEKYVKEKLDEYTDKTARQRYLTNEKYIAFRTAIWVRLRFSLCDGILY